MTRQRLDPRYVRAERVRAAIVLAVFAAAGTAALPIVWLSSAIHPLWPALAMAGGAAIGAWLIARATVWPAVSYRRAWYAVDDTRIEIGRGVVFRRVTLVPRSRVQHTDVTQGPIERRFGLGTLVIHTAGTELASVMLPGLAHESAMALRDALLPKDGADAV